MEAAQLGQARKRSFVSTTGPNTRRCAFSRAVAVSFCRLGNQRPRTPLSRMVFPTAILLGRCPLGRDARLQGVADRPRSPLAGAACGFLRKLKAASYRSPIGLQCYAVQGDKRENLRQSIKAWKEYGSCLATEGTGVKYYPRQGIISRRSGFPA